MADKQTDNKKAKSAAPKADAPKAPKAAKPAAKKDGGEAPAKAKAPRELRAKNHMKIISLAPEVL